MSLANKFVDILAWGRGYGYLTSLLTHELQGNRVDYYCRLERIDEQLQQLRTQLQQKDEEAQG